MDPNTTYALLAHAIGRLATREDMSGVDETIVESWRALDGWLARGGFKPAAWGMHDRLPDLVNAVDDVQRELTQLTTLVDELGHAQPSESPTRRIRPVRADDATHPRELPDPADEAAFAQRTADQRRAFAIQNGRVNDTVTVAELQEELSAHPTWCGESELPPDQRVAHDDLRDS